MKKTIFIYGAGGLGRELLAMLRGSDDWEPAGFLDDNTPSQTLINGVKVLGGTEIINQLPKPANVILAIGDPLIKQKLGTRLEGIPGLQFPTLVHPRAILQDREYIHIGAGSVITAGCILTTDIQIGNHVLINLNCTVGHNTVVGDYSSIMPGVNLAGQVTIGASVLVGSGADILNGIEIGDHSRVGAGAVVTKDVPAGVVVVGVPAKIK